MVMKSTGKSSTAMAAARIVVGLLFIMFAQYKLLHPDFAHEGYQKTVTGYVQETSLRFYKPFLRATLKYPVASGYAVGVAELLIGASMVLGFWVLPAGTPAWRYLGNQLDNISLFLLFLLFFVHSAGETLGLDRSQ